MNTKDDKLYRKDAGMELGNACFGHSRGEFALERETWQNIFHSLLDKDGIEYGAVPFENQVFIIRPYFWGDCKCDDESECTCEASLPNFEHFRSGLKVCWYKHPFRDSYANKEVSETELRKIVEECEKSLEE